jgi:hypothetical protein
MNRNDFPARHRLLALAASACLTIVAPAALGADAAAPAGTVKRPAKAPAARPAEATGQASGANALLTRDELRQCVTERERMKQETADIVQAQAALARDRAEIDRVSASIDADRGGVDRGDQAAVDAFNERAKARTRLIEAYQAAAPKFNQRIDKLDADKQAYAKACDDRRYDEKDLDAIKAGK